MKTSRSTADAKVMPMHNDGCNLTETIGNFESNRVIIVNTW